MAEQAPWFIRVRSAPYWREVKGQAVTIPGFEDFAFFVHLDAGVGGGPATQDWTVSEARTGLAIIVSQPTKLEAIASATKHLESYGRQKCEALCKKAIAAYGLSPRYKE